MILFRIPDGTLDSADRTFLLAPPFDLVVGELAPPAEPAEPEIESEGFLGPSLAEYLLGSSALAGLIGERISPGALGARDELPAVTYWIISDVPGHLIDGPDLTQTARVQLAAISDRYRESLEIHRAIRDRLEGLNRMRIGSDRLQLISARGAGASDRIERPADGSDDRIYKRIADYLIRYALPSPDRDT